MRIKFTATSFVKLCADVGEHYYHIPQGNVSDCLSRGNYTRDSWAGVPGTHSSNVGQWRHSPVLLDLACLCREGEGPKVSDPWVLIPQPRKDDTEAREAR